MESHVHVSAPLPVACTSCPPKGPHRHAPPRRSSTPRLGAGRSLGQVVHQGEVVGQLGQRRDLWLLVNLVHAPLVLLRCPPLLLFALLPLVPGINEHAPVALCLHLARLAPGDVVGAGEDVRGKLSLCALHHVAPADVHQLSPYPRLQGHDAWPLRRVELPQEALAL
eukprot:UN4652